MRCEERIEKWTFVAVIDKKERNAGIEIGYRMVNLARLCIYRVGSVSDI